MSDAAALDGAKFESGAWEGAERRAEDGAQGGCAHCAADDSPLGAGAVAGLSLLGLFGLIRRRRS